MTTHMAQRDYVGLALFGVLAMGAPLAVSGNRFFAFIVGVTLIDVLWASGMNLLYGYAGLMPLMFAGIAGVSAYLTIWLTGHDWSFWLALPAASIAAALGGVVLGLPSLRLRGFYFTLCSLVIQTVISLAFVYFSDFTNGDTGISQIALPAWRGGAPLSPVSYDLVVAGAAVLGVFVCRAVVGSDLGRRLLAIREDDRLAEMLGINATRTKMTAFFIGSLFAAVGGALYGPYIGFISPRGFDVLASLNIWLMVAFGGRGTISGPILGAILLAPIPFVLQNFFMIKDVLYGLLIIVVTIMMPNGIVSGLNWPPLLRDRPRSLKEARHP